VAAVGCMHGITQKGRGGQATHEAYRIFRDFSSPVSGESGPVDCLLKKMTTLIKPCHEINSTGPLCYDSG
jgi:hypothetical protein